MPVGIVHPFEVIDAEHDQAVRTFDRALRGQKRSQLLVETLAVQDAGQ